MFIKIIFIGIFLKESPHPISIVSRAIVAEVGLFELAGGEAVAVGLGVGVRAGGLGGLAVGQVGVGDRCVLRGIGEQTDRTEGVEVVGEVFVGLTLFEVEFGRGVNARTMGVTAGVGVGAADVLVFEQHVLTVIDILHLV